MSEDTLPVEVWSDVVCPWCCIGRAHLSRALEEFEHADAVTVTWRSFELEPDAPATADESLAEHLAARFGIQASEVGPLFEDVSERAAALGLDFRFDIARTGSTFDAHRLLHLARETGLQDDLKGRLMAAYFSEGEAIGDPSTLARLSEEVGLDPVQVADVLATDRYAQAVRHDEADARALQVTGVPFFVIDGRYGLAGAQPAEQLLAVLRRAWSERQAA